MRAKLAALQQLPGSRQTVGSSGLGAHPCSPPESAVSSQPAASDVFMDDATVPNFCNPSEMLSYFGLENQSKVNQYSAPTIHDIFYRFLGANLCEHAFVNRRHHTTRTVPARDAPAKAKKKWLTVALAIPN